MLQFGAILALVWWGILLVCWGVVLVDAFKNGSALNFLLCLVIPFYGLYWVFFRQTMYRKTVVSLIGADLLLGVVFMIGGSVAGNPNDPCKLVTRADVEDALGQPVEGPTHVETRAGTACRYTTVIEPKNTLQVVVTEGIDFERQDKDLPPGVFIVENLGDYAINMGADLHVQKGTTVFSLSWKPGDGSLPSRPMSEEAEDAHGTLEARKKLAQVAMGRYKP